MSIRGKKAIKILITTLKIIWVPAVLVIALMIGLYLGYEFIAERPGSEVFSKDIWKNFIDQIKSLL